MTRENYQDDLADLRRDVREMGDLVLGRLDDGLACLAGDADDGLAREVIAGDDEVNERYLALEDDCVDLIALQQPVAGDLRFVVASFKILTDLERVADLAVNLAEYSLAASSAAVPTGDLEAIGERARGLVERALDAYADADPDECRAIGDADDEIDALCARANETVVRDLIEREADADAWTVESLLDDVSRVLLTVRDLERVGDHAVNVAARTLYMTENDPALIY
ncbi:phosphate signaling complex protein PhoU [Salarchaeum sp. JOR-1]|uniref:phosphate signaling complex protein PhoU n=1 Tax=Salarchaeum sp. JOR-1 TaxID=2599399 RepID=UPI001198B18E|nr:phosphate signaling complex protein PhoU [Salarchaeum sp. JOR-1]QDX41075.1 phosphate signaling complex protein PhoU [Salarchaeum sp. JOR-1]